MTAKTIEDLLPTDEELAEEGFDEDEMDEGLAEHEARAQKISDGLQDANIVAD